MLQLSDGPWFDSGWPDLKVESTSEGGCGETLDMQIHPARIELATFSVLG